MLKTTAQKIAGTFLVIDLKTVLLVQQLFY